jgi:hypothetical protein
MTMPNAGASDEPTQSELSRRVAEAQRRRERANARARLRAAAVWDPAAAAGVSPKLLTIVVVVFGAALGALAFDASRAPSWAERAQAEEARIAEEVYVQPEVEVAPPSVPEPTGAVADYYLLLRQAMYDIAWNRTTAEFQAENYPGGYPDFVRFWAGRAEIEVVDSEVESQSQDEASVVAEVHDIGSDDSARNNYRLRYDAEVGLWKIMSITPAW